MLVPTTMAPMVSAASITPQPSGEFKGVSLSDTFKMDKTAIGQSITKGEPIVLSIDGQKVSFVLEEKDILSSDFSICYANGMGFSKAQTRGELRTYIGIELSGANLVTSSITSGKMHFAVDMPNGKTYYVDALDGTGQSGYYAAYAAGDINNPVSLDGSAAVTVPVSTQSGSTYVPVATSISASEESSTGNSSGTVAPQDGTREAVASDCSVQGSGANVVQTMAAYSNERTTYKSEVFVACDYTYWSTHQYWWSDIVTPFFDIEARFEQQTGIYQHISRAVQLPNDVCTSTDSATLLEQFRSYLITPGNVAASERDSAILCSGKTLSGGIVKAYETGAGLKLLYGSDYDGYGCAVMQMMPTSPQNEWLMGHGLALTYNADEAYGQYNGGSATWMYGTYYSTSTLNFETANIARMKSWSCEVLPMRYINYGPSAAETRAGLNIIAKNMEVSTTDNVFTVGSQVTARFDIENLGGTSKTFNTISLVVRDSNGNAWNIGFQGPITINAGSQYSYSYTFAAQFSGEYTLWPTFNYQGTTGVSEWLDIHPTFYYQLSSWQNHATSGYSTDLFYRWGLYSTVANPVQGSTVHASFTVFNTNSGTGSDNYQQIGLGIRNPSNTALSAGLIASTLTQKAGGVVGGGQHIVVDTTLQSPAGIWKFWPIYETSAGNWGPVWAPMYINTGYSFAGYITDSTTGNPIVGATVTCPGHGSYVTDTNGFYAISTGASGSFAFTATATNYNSHSGTGIAGQYAGYGNSSFTMSYTGTSVNIAGHIYDAVSGEAIANATITTRSGTLYTDINGYYLMPGCHVGNVIAVTVSKTHFVDVTAPVQVASTTFDLRLGRDSMANRSFGVDETTALAHAINAYINNVAGEAGLNMNFPGPGGYMSITGCSNEATFWDKYFEYCQYYDIDLVRVGAADLWGTSIQYDAWKNHTTDNKYPDMLVAMCDRSYAHNVKIVLVIAGSANNKSNDPIFAFNKASNPFDNTTAAYWEYIRYANSTMGILNNMTLSHRPIMIDLWNEPDHNHANYIYWHNRIGLFHGWSNGVARQTSGHNQGYLRTMGTAVQANMTDNNTIDSSSPTNKANLTLVMNTGLEVWQAHLYRTDNGVTSYQVNALTNCSAGHPLFWGEVGLENWNRNTYMEQKIYANGWTYVCSMMLYNATADYPYAGVAPE
ncbi:MAG: hypothetical protein SA339_07145 [Methanomassiliicoccus sp.]|nr:hypothetical protein [Methanomassiliicoccus sp.]